MIASIATRRCTACVADDVRVDQLVVIEMNFRQLRLPSGVHCVTTLGMRYRLEMLQDVLSAIRITAFMQRISPSRYRLGGCSYFLPIGAPCTAATTALGHIRHLPVVLVINGRPVLNTMMMSSSGLYRQIGMESSDGRIDSRLVVEGVDADADLNRLLLVLGK